MGDGETAWERQAAVEEEEVVVVPLAVVIGLWWWSVDDGSWVIGARSLDGGFTRGRTGSSWQRRLALRTSRPGTSLADAAAREGPPPHGTAATAGCDRWPSSSRHVWPTETGPETTANSGHGFLLLLF
jgi:hypothetical protein